MSFTCEDHARQLSDVSNAIVCHHYILSISPYISINNLHKDVMNTLNDNSFLEEIMGVEGNHQNSAVRTVNCLFSARALDTFHDNRIDTITNCLTYLDRDLVVYIDPGKFKLRIIKHN